MTLQLYLMKHYNLTDGSARIVSIYLSDYLTGNDDRHYTYTALCAMEFMALEHSTLADFHAIGRLADLVLHRGKFD